MELRAEAAPPGSEGIAQMLERCNKAGVSQAAAESAPSGCCSEEARSLRAEATLGQNRRKASALLPRSLPSFLTHSPASQRPLSAGLSQRPSKSHDPSSASFSLWDPASAAGMGSLIRILRNAQRNVCPGKTRRQRSNRAAAAWRWCLWAQACSQPAAP